MGSRVFKTSGTKHGTFHKTANESHETFMRRGGGVQIDEEPHVARKKRRRHKTNYLSNIGIVTGAMSEWAEGQRDSVRLQHASGFVARRAWLSTPVLQRNFAGSVRIASRWAIVLGSRSPTNERAHQWVIVFDSMHGP